MGTPGTVAAAAIGTLLALPFAVHAIAYGRAALRKRRARAACPFDDDDHETLPLLRAVQLVGAEGVLWLWALATALRPPRMPGPPTARDVPLVVLLPSWLPRAGLRTLVTRLRRDGFYVDCRRLAVSSRSPARRQRGVDAILRDVWERTNARTIDVLAVANAAADVAAHLAAGGSGVPIVRRLVTVGAAGGVGPRVPVDVETIAFYSPDDPLLGPLERARRPEALGVAVRALGRLGLLHAPHVYPLLREHLLAPPHESRRAWTSARS